MKDTSIEILLASYNGEAYIREQLDSILEQSDNRWHLTVSDDGSTDCTTKILDDYIGYYPEKISRIHSGKRFGNARDHFFWMIGQCKSNYIFTCDQDDRWHCKKVERLIEALQEAECRYGSEIPLLVFSDQTPTDGQRNPLAPSLMRYQNQFFGEFDYRSILMQNVVTGGAMGFNRALAELAMKCVDPAQTIMHDWWIAAVAARFGRVIYIDEPLSDYRQHGSNSVGAKNVHSAAHIANKAMHPAEIRKALLEKKVQACVFRQTYEKQLDRDDDQFLMQFAKRQSGPLFYWKNRKLIHGFFRLTGMMLLG